MIFYINNCADCSLNVLHDYFIKEGITPLLVTVSNGVGTFTFNDNENQEAIQAIINNIESIKLSAAKERKISELQVSCSNTINSSFTSSALGTPHLYSYDTEAQRNLTIAIDAIPYYPENATIEWRIHDTRECIAHNKSQIIQLYLDSVTHVQTNVTKFRTKETQVNNATTVEDVMSITW